ncbi:protein-glutamine gamma-glutamyltransferase 4 isoform X2 [Cavia porcellus]|uniref:protein-glutamine gamma-glutamyltransferase 4 isoform X2 n=1 Tax=Cavia porcellus TaxID=10141 RepID=UPI000661FAB0|nr:protein-glutamine gamma-glutamyltransferase 4 [Cavia porcellus]
MADNKQETMAEELQIRRVDFMRRDNTAAHHTAEFQTPALVLRRGQAFTLRLKLNQRLRSQQDTLTLQFSMGRQPCVSKHTLISLDLPSSASCHGWKASIRSEAGLEVVIAVTSAPNAIVGLYSLELKSGRHLLKPEDSMVYLLFNPWCPEDAVFLPSEEDRAEYVLSDTGYVYMGSFRQVKEKPWNFGQFEKNVLDCCIFLMTQSYLKTMDMRDPVMVGRNMGAMINSQNKDGVLVGNWTGEYQGGMAPYLWTGSVPILQRYYSTREPVSFGQCWVFAGVLTTVLRALGIPARPVTVFDSAHDTEENLTLDVYVNEMGKTVPNKTDDSIWNFHVWTEAWMKRMDLPPGNDGWQVVDGTPQELSQGLYCCGPSPVAAVRKGNIFMGYDTKFVYSEVNADKLVWLVRSVDGREKVSLLSVETMSIGKNISTKAAGQDRRSDITHQYKFPEGSAEEREVMDHAFSLLSFKREHTIPTKENLLELLVQEEPVVMGDPLNFSVTLRRKAATPQTITFSGSFDLQSYTGRQLAHLGVVQKTVQVQEQVSSVVLTWEASTYTGSLDAYEDEPVIKGYIMAEVMETNETIATEVSLFFQYPQLTLELPNTGRMGQALVGTCVFRNSLLIPLTGVRFSVESLGLSSSQSIEHGTVAPGETVQSQISCTPVRLGLRKVIVKLSSQQVKEVHAEKVVLVTP